MKILKHKTTICTIVRLLILKKIWNRADCQSSEKKKIQTHRKLKEPFLIRWNRTKCADFWGRPLFQAMYNNKTEKQTIQLILCQLDVGGWQKEKERLTWVSLVHKTDSSQSFFFPLSRSHALFLPQASHIQLTQDKLN